MVDLETQQAGGIAGALELIEDWNVRYEIRDYYYEDNSQQVEFFADPRMRKLRTRLGLNIMPYTTGRNKQDPEFGISAMAPWYHNGVIDLPYATPEARRKVNVLLSQLEMWTTDGVLRGRHRPTDIKMAQWFPFPRMIRWSREAQYQTQLVRDTESSYPGISHLGAVPWHTPYPKG